MKTLYDELKSYTASDYYGFHMPGHKRNGSVTGASLPYDIDITEIEGFDDLHHAKGILKQAQDRAAQLYHAEETYFLVNGSTVGILSAILGCTQRGDQILTARNCHKSVYHAIFLNELEPVYLYPEFDDEKELNGPVKAEDVRKILRENPGIRAVMITSPTYDGVVSDIKKISEAAHESGIPLIVDEAHGAHFGFHPYFPERANVLGADVVINSVHKTLPALTQTALIHINGPYADREAIRNYLHMLQSSSPSYVLMASIDECIRLLEEQGRELFDSYVHLLDDTRKRLSAMKYLCLAETDDRSKLVISVKGADCSSRALYQKLLKQYHLQMEMTAGSYVLGMTSVGDTKEGMERLVRALTEIDAELGTALGEITKCSFELPHLEQVYTCADTARRIKDEKERILTCPWEQAEGLVSAEYAYLYPPGIPLIVPGERISGRVVGMLSEYRDNGFEIEGLKADGEIRVLRQKNDRNRQENRG